MLVAMFCSFWTCLCLVRLMLEFEDEWLKNDFSHALESRSFFVH